MIQVRIVSAPEDAAAQTRLSAALADAQISTHSHSFGETTHCEEDTGSTSAAEYAATVFLWSKNALASEAMKAQAIRLNELGLARESHDPQHVFGLIVDDLKPSELPTAFHGSGTISWQSWFASPEADKSDARLIALLGKLTSAPSDNASDVAIATNSDPEDAKTIQPAEFLEQEPAGMSELERRLSELSAELRADLERKCDLVEKQEAKITTLDSQRNDLENAKRDLTHQVRLLSEKLNDESQALISARTDLESERDRVAQEKDLNERLTRELEDARTGLTAALRQHKTLQAQVDASDQIIREIMTQREALISAREKLERDTEKLSLQLTDAMKRLDFSDLQRRTYESALVERTKEIRTLEEQAAHAGDELKILKPRAETLSQNIKNWDHVPWRSIAVGSLVIGCLFTYSAVIGGQALERWSFPTKQGLAQARPADQAAGQASNQTLLPPAEIGADSGNPPDQDTGSAKQLATTETRAQDDGVISIPNESEVPISNDQVQFNPAGLPPADLDSRPPPQDLPPMQQKPRLQLKPKSFSEESQ